MALIGAQFVNAVSPNPVGSLQAYAGASAPTGWLLCDGTSYSTSVYPELFNVLGYTYGGSAGNFNVPDLRGRMPIGAGNDGTAANNATRTRGDKGGDTRMPTHNHGVTDPGHYHGGISYGGSGGGPPNNTASWTVGGASSGANSTFGNTGQTTTGVSVNNAGAGSADNMPPFLVTNYIIKAVPDAPRSGLAYGSTPPIVTALPANPQFGEEVVHRQTVAGTTYSTLKQWDGTVWVATGPQPATTWVSPTLNSPWTNYSGGWQAARYTRDAMGTVFIEGLVNGAPSPSVIFNLPAGFRPAAGLIFSTVANNGFARIDVAANGDVSWNTGGTSAFISINCNFKASQ